MSQPLFATFLILALLLFNQAYSQKCAYGQIKKSGKCQDCPPGTFVSFLGNKCDPCPKGTFNPFSRAPAEEACRYCLEDTFNNAKGATECQPCPRGTMADRGATKCAACGPGTELSFDRCRPCQRGHYSNGTINRECTMCEWPLTGPVGSTSIKNCKKCSKPGTSGYACFSCDSGNAIDEKTGLCTKCPQGTIHKPRFFATKCARCPAGTFATFGQRRKNGSFLDFCKQCPAGTTSNKGAMTCRVSGEPCKKGFFENKDGNCEKCRTGFFVDEARKACVPCPEGSASLGGLRTKCVKCTGELVPDSDTALCRCPRGRFYRNGKCFNCPAGTGGNFENSELRGRDGCLKCDVGYFQDQPGQPQCKRCPYGTVAEKGGAASCKPCPKGSMPAFDPSEENFRCATLETGCPIGFRYRNFWGTSCVRKKPKKKN